MEYVKWTGEPLRKQAKKEQIAWEQLEGKVTGEEGYAQEDDRKKGSGERANQSGKGVAQNNPICGEIHNEGRAEYMKQSEV